MHLKSVLRRLSPFGGGDEILGGRRMRFLAIRDSDYEGQRRGSEQANFQSWAGQTIQGLRNNRDSAACLDRSDEAGDTAMLFRNQRRGFDWRKPVGEPGVIFRIIGER